VAISLECVRPLSPLSIQARRASGLSGFAQCP
jgi:hypothetical protein